MRIDLLEAFGLDPNVIAILKRKYREQLLPIQERAFKEYQILNGGNFLVSAVTSSYVDHKFYYDHYVNGRLEEMTPALNRREMDRHILNLVASEICRDAGEIENSYEVFSGAIKRVGEDFSWLAETLAALARDIQWDPRAIEKISALSQRLIYGVTEKGLALSKIRLRGLGRTYINCLVDEGYDTPEAISRRQQFEGL